MRQRLSPEELRDLLEAEFRATAADHCLRCRVPLPSYFAGARNGPNWRLAPLADCGGLCHTILQDMAASMAQRYELKGPD